MQIDGSTLIANIGKFGQIGQIGLKFNQHIYTSCSIPGKWKEQNPPRGFP